MAMMECPNCGEQVSDKAKKCVHCGVILIPEEKRYCQECAQNWMLRQMYVQNAVVLSKM